MPPIIELNHATVKIGTTTVLDDVSFTLNSAQHTAILGPNGAGKSSLLKTLCGDLRPIVHSQGAVKFLGQERWSLSNLKYLLGIITPALQEAHEQMGHLIVDVVILSGFFDSIGLYHPISHEQKQRLAQIKQQLGIEQLSQQAFATLSSGQKRKCLIARALIRTPQALILDEPTTGLDIKAQFDFIQFMRRIAGTGTTLLLVTHHVEEIIPEIQQVAFLENARIKAQGPKQSLLNANNLSALFQIPLELEQANGFYRLKYLMGLGG